MPKVSGGGHTIVGEPRTIEEEYAAVWKRASRFQLPVMKQNGVGVAHTRFLALL